MWEASPVRGARLPRLQDLGQAQRPGRDGARLRAARRGRRLAAAPRRHRGRPGVPGHDQVRDRVRRAALARASATPSGSRCPRRRSRRSRSASRSCSRSTCARASSRSSPARPAAAPRSTSTSWPSEVTAGLDGLEVPLRVAVMGCVVNGPGEAREADLGVASGNGKGQIFVKGEVIKTVPGVPDRGDPDRGGHADRRGHGGRRRHGRRGHRLLGRVGADGPRIPVESAQMGHSRAYAAAAEPPALMLPATGPSAPTGRVPPAHLRRLVNAR